MITLGFQAGYGLKQFQNDEEKEQLLFSNWFRFFVSRLRFFLFERKILFIHLQSSFLFAENIMLVLKDF